MAEIRAGVTATKFRCHGSGARPVHNSVARSPDRDCMTRAPPYGRPDRAVCALAAEQSGIVARVQLLELGLTPAHARRDATMPGRGRQRARYARPRGSADRAQHPVRRLRAPRRRGRRRGGRRLAARRRDGQPLRAEPDDRPAGGLVAAAGHRHSARLPSDDHRPGPVGDRVRGGRRVQRHRARRGGRRPGRARPRRSARPARRRGCRSSPAPTSTTGSTYCGTTTRCW